MNSSSHYISPPKKIKFIILGGFLGAGKTTTMIRFAQWLQKRNLRVGIITNDQAPGLVDTQISRAASLHTGEIAGGCFCCRSDALVEITDRITKEADPDVFLAEPVGSCTDLVATVALPLVQIYKRAFDLAPMTVLIDPLRATRVLAADRYQSKEAASGGFSTDVDYIYRKQLDEAQLIAINKCEIIAPARLKQLGETLEREFPSAKIEQISARSGDGLEKLFSAIMTNSFDANRLIEIDYSRYAAGESRLGWFNATYDIQSVNSERIDADRLILEFSEYAKARFEHYGIEVAHLKATIVPADDLSKDGDVRLAAVQWVGSGRPVEVTSILGVDVKSGVMTVNIRAECAPSEIRSIVDASRMITASVIYTVKQSSDFRPGAPTPIFRASDVSIESVV